MSSIDQTQHERVTLDLLAFIGRHAVDDDYAVASQFHRPGQRPFGWRSLVALVLFAMLVMTAAVQTSKGATKAQHDRETLLAQVASQRRTVTRQTAELDHLQERISTLQVDLAAPHRGELLALVTRLAARAGVIPVRGPGVVVTVADAPGANDAQHTVLDSDLQRLVSALWESGAQAIAIDGERITTLTTIRTAGEAILVNYRPISQPYVVRAIGDPAQMPGRFAQTTFGATWFDLHSQMGIRFDMHTVQSMRLPGEPKRLTYAKPRKEGSS